VRTDLTYIWFEVKPTDILHWSPIKWSVIKIYF